MSINLAALRSAALRLSRDPDHSRNPLLHSLIEQLQQPLCQPDTAMDVVQQQDAELHRLLRQGCAEIERETLQGGDFHNRPGEQKQVVPGTPYVCPQADCAQYWYRRDTQAPVPLCPVHKVAMTPATADTSAS